MELPEEISSTFLSIMKDAENNSERKPSYIMFSNHFEKLYSQKNDAVTRIIIPYFAKLLLNTSFQDMLVKAKIKDLEDRIQYLESNLQHYEKKCREDIDYIGKLRWRRNRAKDQLESTTFESIIKELDIKKDSFISSLSNCNNNHDNFNVSFWLETYTAYSFARDAYLSFLDNEVIEGRYPEFPIDTIDDA